VLGSARPQLRSGQRGDDGRITESIGQIWTELTRRYGLPLVLLEHYQRPNLGRRRHRSGRPYGEVPAVRGSFSVRPPAKPDVPAFPASGFPVTYAVAVLAAGGRSAWIWSWQGGQTMRDLRRFAAMSLAQAGWL
jgi:hypothetical protein